MSDFKQSTISAKSPKNHYAFPNSLHFVVFIILHSALHLIYSCLSFPFNYIPFLEFSHSSSLHLPISTNMSIHLHTVFHHSALALNEFVLPMKIIIRNFSVLKFKPRSQASSVYNIPAPPHFALLPTRQI